MAADAPRPAGVEATSSPGRSAQVAGAGWHTLDPAAKGGGQIDLFRERRQLDSHSVTASAAVPLGADRAGVRLLIYTQDGLGLGHLRRASSVAAEFLRGDPEASVLTISDSPLGSLMRDVPHHDYLKLPSIVKAGPSEWRPHSLPMEIGEMRGMRSRLILEAARAFAPDVLLVDHMPHGAMGELLPTLESLGRGATSIVLGVRDIIDAPGVVRQRWWAEGALDALAAYYDQVLVYGSPEVFDLPHEYGWPVELARLVRYCGYVCAPERSDPSGRAPARRLAPASGGPMIVAMAGGGADAYTLMSTLVDAVPEICAAQPCSFVMVTGPFMPDLQRRDLRQRAEGLPVRLRTMVGNPLKYVAAADLVVAMAGYNTTMEVLRLGTPALLVPRGGPSGEQRMRARRFAERGWVSQLDPDDLAPGRLAAAVVEALSARQHAEPGPPPDLGGLARAAEQLHVAGLVARATVSSRWRTPASVELIGQAV